jgi:hypothetical protein
MKTMKMVKEEAAERPLFTICFNNNYVIILIKRLKLY